MTTFFQRLLKRSTIEYQLLLALVPLTVVMVLIDNFIDIQAWSANYNALIITLVKSALAIPVLILLIYTLAKILDRKLANTRIALETSEERFRSIFEKNSAAILLIETDKSISMCNDAYCEMTGYSREEVVGKSWTQLIPESELERLTTFNTLRLQNSPDIPDNYELMFVKKNGDVRVGLMSVFYDRLINEIVTSITDITERKQMEVSLEESREKYRKLIDLQGEGFGVVDREERFILTNPAADRIMGVPVGKLVGRKIDEFVNRNNFDLVRQQSDIRRAGNQTTYELEFIRADGEKRVMLITASPTFDAQGQFESTLGIFLDITDRKNIENALKKNESELKALNNTKDKLFSIIAHDLRGPVGTSADLLEVLIENYANFNSDEQLKMLDILKNSAKSTYNLLETLLNRAIIQTGNLVFKPELFNLTKCIENAVKNLVPTALSKNITLLFKSERDIFSYADQNMILTVLRNLIGNAVKYTYRGGLIEVKLANQGNRTEISITDNGMGMDETTKQNLFVQSIPSSKYGTENEKGTGLGLILCKEFVDKHGGHITVESEPGKGSRFIIDIPMVHSKAEAPFQASEPVVRQGLKQFSNETILIVEDEDINYQVLRSILTSINLNYDRAINGKEAVDKFLHNNYSLILMDVQLPEMNGWEATMKIRENDSDIPIIAVTAYASDPTRIKSLEAGCNDFVTKPINKAKLIQVIEKHLKKDRISSIIHK